MELEEQLKKLQKDFEKANNTHAASLADMTAENDRMKQHMQEAVAKEKSGKGRKEDTTR